MPRGDKRFAKGLVFVDAVAVISVLGLATAPVASLNPIYFELETQFITLNYWAFSAFIGAIWLFSLGWGGTRSFRVVGSGWTEYKKIIFVSIVVFSAVGLFSYFAKAEISRSYFIESLLGGTLLLLLFRWVSRVWLTNERQRGKLSSRVFLIGSPQSVDQVREEIMRHPEAGLIYGGEKTFSLPSEALNTLNERQQFCSEIISSVNASNSPFLIVCNSESLNADVVQLLSWELDPHKHELILAPSLRGIHETRIHSKQLAGLSLLFVSTPDLQSNKKLIKRAVDLFVSFLLFVLLLPVMLMVALAIKIESKGPVLYRQERIGYQGKPFKIYKFRSMRENADQELLALLDSQGDRAAIFSKVRSDPRLTRVGSFIRKYSIDELPQLLNVLLGSMSLVGPRPHRDFEVAKYDSASERRLLVKPGMTGLWQVSGRSNLDAEESMELDVYYVENWSLSFDWLILAKTIRAVLIPGESSV